MDMNEQFAIARGMQQKTREMQDVGDTLRQWEYNMQKDEKLRLAQNKIEDQKNATQSIESKNKTSTSNKYETCKTEGNTRFKKGAFSDAIAWYEKAMEATADTQNISILYCNRAMCQLKMKEFAAAKQSCNKALELDITSEKSWFRLMQACKNMDESTETLQAGLEVLKLNPKNVAAKQVVDELTKQNIRVPVKRVYVSTLDGMGENVSFIDKPPHLQSRLPLKNIMRRKSVKIPSHAATPQTTENNNDNECAVEIDMNFIEKAAEQPLQIVKNSSSTTSFYKNTKDLENNTIKLSRPSNSAEFVREWKAKSSTLERFALLKAIPIQDLAKLVRPHLDSDILAELLQVLSIEFIRHDITPMNHLLELSKCNEVGILAMMMGVPERNAIAAIVEDANRRHEHFLKTISNTYNLKY